MKTDDAIVTVGEEGRRPRKTIEVIAVEWPDSDAYYVNGDADFEPFAASDGKLFLRRSVFTWTDA